MTGNFSRIFCISTDLMLLLFVLKSPLQFYFTTKTLTDLILSFGLKLSNVNSEILPVLKMDFLFWNLNQFKMWWIITFEKKCDNLINSLKNWTGQLRVFKNLTLKRLILILFSIVLLVLKKMFIHHNGQFFPKEHLCKMDVFNYKSLVNVRLPLLVRIKDGENMSRNSNPTMITKNPIEVTYSFNKQYVRH